MFSSLLNVKNCWKTCFQFCQIYKQLEKCFSIYWMTPTGAAQAPRSYWRNSVPLRQTFFPVVTIYPNNVDAIRWCTTWRWKALLLFLRNFFLTTNNSSRITCRSLNLKVSLKVTFYCLKMIPVGNKFSWWASNYQKSCEFVLKSYYGSYRCFWNLTQVSHDRWR